jgi:hypothetical protein
MAPLPPGCPGAFAGGKARGAPGRREAGRPRVGAPCRKQMPEAKCPKATRKSPGAPSPGIPKEARKPGDLAKGPEGVLDSPRFKAPEREPWGRLA